MDFSVASDNNPIVKISASWAKLCSHNETCENLLPLVGDIKEDMDTVEGVHDKATTKWEDLGDGTLSTTIINKARSELQLLALMLKKDKYAEYHNLYNLLHMYKEGEVLKDFEITPTELHLTFVDLSASTKASVVTLKNRGIPIKVLLS